jgi:hypothetical protein
VLLAISWGGKRQPVVALSDDIPAGYNSRRYWRLGGMPRRSARGMYLPGTAQQQHGGLHKTARGYVYLRHRHTDRLWVDIFTKALAFNKFRRAWPSSS